MKLTRRQLLQASAFMAGFLLTSNPLHVGARPKQYNQIPFNPKESRSLAIVGAGISGLAAAYLAAKAGFRVIVLEADDRYGGRSLTLRPDDPTYRDWWFNTYNPLRLFERMYISSKQERNNSPAPDQETASFKINKRKGGNQPVELYLNLGPGRIASIDTTLLSLCDELDVGLEPYIFKANNNLLYSDRFEGGQPVRWQEVHYSLIGEVAELLNEAVKEGLLLKGYDRERVLSLLRHYGNLNESGSFDKRSSVAGFVRNRGGWKTPFAVEKPLALKDVINGDFVKPGKDDPMSFASYLYLSNSIDWQPTLMQPEGGMDRIWQKLLLQSIPSQTLLEPSVKPHNHGTRVGDLVHLKAPVQSITNQNSSVLIDVKGRQKPLKVDACIVTVAPPLLGGASHVTMAGASSLPMHIPQEMRISTNLPAPVKRALASVEMVPAIKVGLQAHRRFWEQDDDIYGGISWTTHLSRQIWYPSANLMESTGILTAAYNAGSEATTFGNLSRLERIEEAAKGGTSLHTDFRADVDLDGAISMAWQYMPWQVGGFANDTYLTQPEIYETITDWPQGGILLAGDSVSQMPGWQEGAVSAALLAVRSLVENRRSTDPALYS